MALQCLSHSPELRSTAMSRASTLRLADTTTRSNTGSWRYRYSKNTGSADRVCQPGWSLKE